LGESIVTALTIAHQLLPSIGIEVAMSKNTSISIGEELSDFVASQVHSGRYGSASEVVRAGLRLLEEHEAKLKALRAALQQGEESGTPTEFDFDAFIERKRRAG
jgi:antitoxin ParD1/3/4